MNAVRRFALTVLAGLVLASAAGCAVMVTPLKVKAPVDYATLAPFDHCMTDKRVIVCPGCFQEKITPRYSVDPTARGFLTWTCQHCGMTWQSKIAKDSR